MIMEVKHKAPFSQVWRRAGIVLLTISLLIPLFPSNRAAAETVSGNGNAAITDYRVVIHETVSSGFKHPGVGLTKEILENVRTQVLEKKDPWYSYYQAMLVSSSAAKDVTSSNQSAADPSKPGSDAFDSQGINSRFIADGLKAYTQALLYYITGDETYRGNALHIIRIWSQMDPAKYKYFQDAHIHTGIPLNRMVTAAEILRYTSYRTESLKWTEQDTADFTNHLITPVIETFQHDNNHFMNQHTYPLLGAMAGYIFTDNRERYNEGVEWFTVNKTAVDQGINGSIQALFRLVDTDAVTGEKLTTPRVQHVEMGRDQAHGGGDLNNAAILSRLLLAQGTKVDPVKGTVSTANNAVNSYQFLNNRILSAADYFSRYMLGYDTPWTPVTASMDPDGKPLIIYKQLSEMYRGRMVTTNFWDIYFYYKYTEGMNLKKEAPYLTEMFEKRPPSNYYYKGNLEQAWDNVDGGGDFWLYIPKKAGAEGSKLVPKAQQDSARIDVEERYTAFDKNAATRKDGDVSYIEVKATENGSWLAPLNVAYGDRSKPLLVGLRFRTNGPAKLAMSRAMGSAPYHTLTLPDTKGEWRYITYDMGIDHVTYSQVDPNHSIVYWKVTGPGTKVGIDSLNVKAGQQLTPPVFKAGSGDLERVAYVGAATSYDFSATDPGPSDRVTYEAEGPPAGAELDPDTGAFRYKPEQAGTYAFTVTATDGTTVATRNVRFEVAEDRKSAVDAAAANYDANTGYVSSSLERFKQAYADALASIGSASDELFDHKLSDVLQAAKELEPLTPHLSDGSLDYTAGVVVASSFGDYLSSLTDGDDNTFAAYGLAADLYHTIDFGSNFKVSADAFQIQGRRSFPERIAGIAVFGSNDGETWTCLTSGTTGLTEDMQRLEVDEAYRQEQFRFLKMQMIAPQSTMLEVSEFRIEGQRYEIHNDLDSVSIASEHALKQRVVPGDPVRLSFTSKETISQVKVSIQGQEAEVYTDDQRHWTADTVLSDDAPMGNVKFNITYTKADGTPGTPQVLTTDNSKLFVSRNDDIIDVLKTADFIDSTGRATADTLKNVANLFDADASTISDFRLNGGGAGGYIVYDFKEGHQAQLTGVELMARQDSYFSRIKGAVVQGSNDLTEWTALTSPAQSTADWQVLPVDEKEAYRYIRMFNAGTWFGNMAELRLHGTVQSSLGR